MHNFGGKAPVIGSKTITLELGVPNKVEMATLLHTTSGGFPRIACDGLRASRRYASAWYKIPIRSWPRMGAIFADGVVLVHAQAVWHRPVGPLKLVDAGWNSV